MKGRFGVWYLRLCQWLARHRLWRPGKIMYIGGSDVLPAPLSREEEGELIARLAEGDQAASSTLIEHNLRLVVYIARRFENTGINIEDLISIGTIGLIKAVGTYQPAKNIKLATYASRCIENEILMHFRSRKKQSCEVSLAEPIDSDKDGNVLSLVDVISSDDNMLEQLELTERQQQLIKSVNTVLDAREREIIIMRYGLFDTVPLPQREVALKCGISRSYVSRLEKKALEKLQKALDD